VAFGQKTKRGGKKRYLNGTTPVQDAINCTNSTTLFTLKTVTEGLTFRQPTFPMLHYKILAFSIILLAMFGLWRRLFPKKKQIPGDFQASWRTILNNEVAFYRLLEAPEQARFEVGILDFLASVNINGTGTAVDDKDRLLVAASAVIPLFGFPGWRYRKLNEVILYEGAFNRDFKTREAEERNILGMVGGSGMTGTMILSKPALHQAFEKGNSTQHVGIHEFVHLLDRADGATDGIPEEMLQRPFLIPWVRLMHREIQAIRAGESSINPYGGTNEAEFFSVVSEFFFQKPDVLKKHHPELYDMLERIFKQDPEGAN